MTEALLQKKFRYHHGQLREALIEAALGIISDQGIEGLNLRALAQATQVSPAAPYSHFRDKQDLLAAVAEAGYQKLALQMVEAATGCKDARTRVEKLVASYIRFALDNKPLFRLMSGGAGDMKEYPTLAMTAGKSYALISAALSKRENTATDTPFLTVAIWSLCHGLTALIVDDKIQLEQFGAAGIDDFVRRTIALFGEQLS